MWEQGHNPIREVRDVNAEFAEIDGELDYEQAQAMLAEFLYHNPAFMVDLMAGIKLFPFQELHIKGWMANDFSMVVWGRGLSKTLVYNDSSQLLEKDRGLISLPDLLPNVDFSHERWVDIPPMYLWNGTGWRLTSKIYVQPQKHCQRVHTANGYYLEGSKNHLIRVLNPKTLEPAWKRYHEIQVGDYVCISRNETFWGCEQTKEEIDEAYLVGLLIGDGCYSKTKDGVGITSADEEILAFIERFPCTKRYPDKRSKAVDIDLHQPFGCALLKKYQMKRSLSYDKSIPARIMANKTLLVACLNGLFDTDGMAIKAGGVSFCTTSEHLSHQVQLALLTFGIISVRKLQKTPSKFGRCYIVRIFGSDADTFSTKIGFRLTRKQSILHSTIGGHRNTNKDVVPGALEYGKLIARHNSSWSVALNDEWHDKVERRGQKCLSYESLSRYVSFFEKAGVSEDLLSPLRQTVDDHYFYSPVTQIDSFVHDCLDFNVPTGEQYWSNGFISHNTWGVALFVLLWALFNPNNRVIVVSFSFRASRNILDQCAKFLQDKGAKLFATNFPNNKDWGFTRSTDEWIWTLPNGSSIKCLPLGDGTKIRGQRADTLVVDEFAFLPEPVIGTILQPFLVAQGNIKEAQTLREEEDAKIVRGEMTEEERTTLEDFKKVIFLSSASYQFEHMYKRYLEWIKEIQNDGSNPLHPKSTASYFVSRLSYEAAPPGLINTKVIEDAKKNTSEAVFDREYRAIFGKDSGGYFSAEKMQKCTMIDGENSVTMELRGEKGFEYVLAIDTALSGAEDSDHFAIQVLKIVKRETDGEKLPMLVHSYAVAGGDLKDHILYFYYLLKNFNIVYIATDASQGDNVEFLNSAIQSALFKGAKLHLSDLTADFKTDDFSNVTREVKLSYNLTEGRIIHKQPFSAVWQRAANEYMQACFDHRRVLFAAHIRANPAAASSAMQVNIDMLREHGTLKKDQGSDSLTIAQFIEIQDNLVDLTKKECAMIVVSTSELGGMRWTLPQNMKRTTGPSRVRRDSYSALLLGIWATKIYLESQVLDVQVGPEEFPYLLI